MVKSLLLVIDVQNDFLNEVTRPIAEKIEELTRVPEFDLVAFTQFVNEEGSLFYEKLYSRHFLTPEQREIAIETQGCPVFTKRVYSAVNDELREYVRENEVERIYLCGFDTDACVQKTALDLFEQGYEVYVLKDYCMSHAGKELHEVVMGNLGRLIGRDRVV